MGGCSHRGCGESGGRSLNAKFVSIRVCISLNFTITSQAFYDLIQGKVTPDNLGTDAVSSTRGRRRQLALHVKGRVRIRGSLLAGASSKRLPPDSDAVSNGSDLPMPTVRGLNILLICSVRLICQLDRLAWSFLVVAMTAELGWNTYEQGHVKAAFASGYIWLQIARVAAFTLRSGLQSVRK